MIGAADRCVRQRGKNKSSAMSGKFGYATDTLMVWCIRDPMAQQKWMGHSALILTQVNKRMCKSSDDFNNLKIMKKIGVLIRARELKIAEEAPLAKDRRNSSQWADHNAHLPATRPFPTKRQCVQYFSILWIFLLDIWHLWFQKPRTGWKKHCW